MNFKLEKFWNIVIGWAEELLILTWTLNLKSFEILLQPFPKIPQKLWTLNLKSFEIIVRDFIIDLGNFMNFKLEKFWNSFTLLSSGKSGFNEL